MIYALVVIIVHFIAGYHNKDRKKNLLYQIHKNNNSIVNSTQFLSTVPNF